MTGPAPLTRSELEALAYFAVGVTSEGSIGGRDVSYRLSFAGSVDRSGRMDPVGNSGYSFGTLQIDLGQHPQVARALLDRYQEWAGMQPDRAALHLDQDAYARMLESLQRTGRQMRAAGAHDIDRTRINRFLASDAGRTFVHELDTQHVHSVTRMDATLGNRDSALERLQRTTLYRDATPADQAKLAGLFMKLENQSGAAYTPRLLTRIEQGTLASVADVKEAIDRLLPNAANGAPDYIQSGADNTLRGVSLFNELRAASADNPLGVAWAAVAANPLIGPVAAHARHATDADLGVQYDAIRSLFLTPEGATRMVRALEQGTSLAEGDPATRHGRRTAGFYVSGEDFVHWNLDGQGVACIGGRWMSLRRESLQRITHRDGTVELRLMEDGWATSLVRVDPRAHRRDGVSMSYGNPQTSGVASVQSSGPPSNALVQPNDPRHSYHPDHALYRQAQRAVHALDASLGRAPDAASERMIASVLRLAKENGFERIDHVVLSRQTGHVAGGQNVFVVQGAPNDPAALRAHMPTEQAVGTPVDESFRALQAIERHPGRSADRAVAHEYAHEPPVHQAPVLQRG